jgi:hypothetical protein
MSKNHYIIILNSILILLLIYIYYIKTKKKLYNLKVMYTIIGINISTVLRYSYILIFILDINNKHIQKIKYIGNWHKYNITYYIIVYLIPKI